MNELKSIVNKALDMLYKNDGYLIQRQIHERSIVFRFGIYFDLMIKKLTEYYGLHLDFDYNRNKENPKRTKAHPHGIYPDLILHQRGSNDNNTLALEFKTYWNENHTDDIGKLKEITSPNQEYKFRLGISIVLGKDRDNCQFTFVQNGEISQGDIHEGSSI
jgi:hypothetical protein